MVRFGIVGCKGIAKKFARDIKFVKNATLTAVSARNKEDAARYKEEYNVDFAYSSYLDLAKSKEIDAVYIATPHSFHHEQAKLFMNHGKHVLVEKSITVNLGQLEDLIETAKENKVLLMEAMWTHFLPSSQYIKNIIKDLGDLKEARLDFGYDLLGNNPKNRIVDPKLAGGSILDIGVYPISFYHFIQKAPIKKIEAKADFTETGVDAYCEISITDVFDAVTTIKSSINSNLSNEANLTYEKGTIRMTDFSRCEVLYINGKKESIPYINEGFPHQIESFARTIEENRIENEIMTHDASLKCISTMDKVRSIIGLRYPFE